MDDLDEYLGRLRAAPLDPRLAAIDDAVMRGVANVRETRATMRTLAASAVVALGLGLGGGLVSGEPAQAADPIALFGAPPALAPSSLLAGT